MSNGKHESDIELETEALTTPLSEQNRFSQRQKLEDYFEQKKLNEYLREDYDYDLDDEKRS